MTISFFLFQQLQHPNYTRQQSAQQDRDHPNRVGGGTFHHGRLRATQSVDHLHHQAQLEEKDKAIEALKQAAKVRLPEKERRTLHAEGEREGGRAVDKE